MNALDVRARLISPRAFGDHSFAILKSLAAIVSRPDNTEVAHELVLRALERRSEFEGQEAILDALLQQIGLYPYLDPETLSARDAIAYEYHRPIEMGDEFVFHREQAEIYRRILGGDSVILSAPTSFGKSRIIDAVIATRTFTNIAVIVPTLALIDETRRRLSRFSNAYKIVTHTTQEASDRNIFVFTAERAISYEPLPKIDFFVIDEFYKLDAQADDNSRVVALNQAFYRLRKQGGQFYLLGPNVQKVPAGLEEAFKCYFYSTRFSTVVTDQIHVGRSSSPLKSLTTLCESLDEPTLIYCRSPARANEVARALLESLPAIANSPHKGAADWTATHYHPDWIYGSALHHGVGVHHGRLPRSLAQYAVRMFNELGLRFLVCTSTLIEGVNTKAKNVIVFDNTIAKEKIDYFTFNNIRGRSGRMFEHYVGRVYIFDDPPTEALPFVDFPLFSQDASTPDSLLVQLDSADLRPAARERVRRFEAQSILPIDVIRANATIEPEAQLALASAILASPREASAMLAWDQFPNGPQLEYLCELAWAYLVKAARGRGGVYSGRQLAFKVWQLMRVPSSAERVRQELRPGKYSAKGPDEAVERVLEFERVWASYELPRLLNVISRIQRAVLSSLSLPFGDYTAFASQIECLFTTPVLTALDEYGVPLQVAKRVPYLTHAESLDAALAFLKEFRPDSFDLDPFEREVLLDVKKGL
jgi:hypothetical protein